MKLLQVGLLGVISLCAQDQREQHWRQDVDFLLAGLGASGRTLDLKRGISSRGQLDFAKLYPENRVKAALETLYADLPQAPDSEIVLQLMRLIASASVGHNRVETPLGMGFFSRLPLEFHWFAEGLAVTAASQQYSAALGAAVVSVGGMTPEKLLAGLAPYVSHENEVWLRQASTEMMRPAGVLRHFGLLGADGQVELILQKDGAPFSVRVTPADPRTVRATLLDTVQKPLFLSRGSTLYWHQYLADSQTLFIQYNSCRNDPKLPFHDFAARALADADAHTVKRVAIDLRRNGGGDSRVIGPLVSGLAKRLKKIGTVYVLIGPATFSSAEDNAIELRRKLHAVLVGEAAGEKPSGYGEVKELTLPNSKLVVRYTTKFFGSKSDTAVTLEPDVRVPRTLADLVAGRDAALEAAIARP